MIDSDDDSAWYEKGKKKGKRVEQLLDKWERNCLKIKMIEPDQFLPVWFQFGSEKMIVMSRWTVCEQNKKLKA